MSEEEPKKTARKWPAQMPYFDNERDQIDEGANVIPYTLSRLETAARQDMANLLIEFAEHARDESNMQWIEGNEEHGSMLARIGTSLEYCISDAEALDEWGGEIISYDFGVTCVLDLAMCIIAARPDKEGNFERDQQDRTSLVNQIHACMIALIARGEVQNAVDLARLAAALRCLAVENDDVSIKEGHNKKVSTAREQLKILVVVISFIGVWEIPTKKAVRLEAFDNRMDPARFSRLISGMAIVNALPDDPTNLGDKDSGKTFDVKPGNVSAFSLIDGGSAAKRKIINDRVNFQATREMLSLKPSGDPNLVHSDVRKIKESLGPVYFLLLIQFGMGEIDKPEDLDRFVNNLSDIGLELK